MDTLGTRLKDGCDMDTLGTRLKDGCDMDTLGTGHTCVVT